MTSIFLIYSYGIISIVIGSILLFNGIKLFRFTLFTSGVVLASILSFLFIDYYGIIGWWKVSILVSLMGTTGGTSCLAFWILGLLSVGGVGGIAFGVHLFSILFSILSIFPSSFSLFNSSLISFHNSDIQFMTGRAVIITSLFFISIFVILMERRVGAILSSSFIGSILIGSGLDLFLKLGYNFLLKQIILNKPLIKMASKEMGKMLIGILETGHEFKGKIIEKDGPLISWPVFLECIGVLLLATLGIYMQTRLYFEEMEYNILREIEGEEGGNRNGNENGLNQTREMERKSFPNAELINIGGEKRQGETEARVKMGRVEQDSPWNWSPTTPSDVPLYQYQHAMLPPFYTNNERIGEKSKTFRF